MHVDFHDMPPSERLRMPRRLQGGGKLSVLFPRGTFKKRPSKRSRDCESDEDEYNDRRDAYIHDYEGNGDDSPLEVINCRD